MSAYQVNKICHEVLHDSSFRDAILVNPEDTISAFKLTDQERAALLEGDVAKLYELGASAFLLYILPRFGVFGLTPDSFNDRMRALAPISE